MLSVGVIGFELILETYLAYLYFRSCFCFFNTKIPKVFPCQALSPSDFDSECIAEQWHKHDSSLTVGTICSLHTVWFAIRGYWSLAESAHEWFKLLQLTTLLTTPYTLRPLRWEQNNSTTRASKATPNEISPYPWYLTPDENQRQRQRSVNAAWTCNAC